MKRDPQGVVTAGNGSVPFDKFRVTQTRTKGGDTFEVLGPLSAIDLGFWLSTTPIPITITMNGAQLFVGNADHIDMNFSQTAFKISGRDNSAKMIDSTTSEKFLNQQPNAIVQTIAGRHGVNLNADTPSGGNAGKIYSADFDAITNRYSEWSLLQRLADLYGMVCYFTNDTLYFKNFDEKLSVQQITYSKPTPQQYENGNFMTLRASRNLILGAPVKVNVRSHHHQKKQVFAATASSAGGSGQPLVYNHTFPIISQSQAQTIADAKLAEVQMHELTIDELSFPGNEAINARMSFQLSGTNSALDQLYDANSIDHEFSWEGGYRTGICIKNKKRGGGGGSSQSGGGIGHA